MKSKELKTVISWIIDRKCKRDDNIHVKRAVRESKKLIKLMKLDKDELIDKLVDEVEKQAGNYFYKLEKPFSYISKVIYDVSLPKIFDDYVQNHVEESLDENN